MNSKSGKDKTPNHLVNDVDACANVMY